MRMKWKQRWDGGRFQFKIDPAKLNHYASQPKAPSPGKLPYCGPIALLEFLRNPRSLPKCGSHRTVMTP